MSKMKSIREIEMERAVAPNFGKGITVASGFDLGAKAPLDSRMTVKTIEERDAHVTGNRAYEGMLVYVEADKKTYQLVNNAWEEFGFNEEKFEAGIKPVKDRLDTLEDLVIGGEGEGIEAIIGDVAQAKEDIVELQANLTKETSDRKAAITELDNKIQKGFDDLDEAVERAFGEMEESLRGADAELKAELNAKISANETAIAKNASDIAKEVQDRTQAINAINSKVSEMDAAYKNADTAIKGRLDSLESNTADLETIRTNIASNTAAISKEVTDRTNAVKSVDDKLTAEVSRATAAEVALGQRIDGVKSDLTTGLNSTKEYVDGKVSTINKNHNELAERVTANEGQLGLVDSKIEAAATTAVNSSKSYTDGQVTALKSTLEAADLQVLSDANAYTDHELTKLERNLTEDITAVEESVETVDGKVVALGKRVTSNEEAIDSLRNALSNKNSNTIVVETEDDIESHNPNPKKGDLAFVISTKRMYIYKENGGAAAPTGIEGRLAPQGWVIFDTITSELDLVDYLKKSDAASTYRRLDTKIVEGDLHTDLSTKINNKAEKTYVDAELAKKTNEAYVNAKVEEVVSPVRTLANQNKTDIANEVTARKAAITTVETAIGTETTNRTQAINTVTSAINTEIADRKEAINTVNSTISGVDAKVAKEVSDREAAVSGVDAKVTQEVKDRQAAMSNETTRVNGLIETLNAKIAQADALIATLQGKLTTLEEIEDNRIVFDQE